MKRLLLILALAFLAVPAAFAARVRVVRHPAEPCSFSLVPGWGTAAIPAAGQTRGIVLVYGQTAACAEWSAYSPVAWVTVEAAPTDAQPAAYVTVAQNTSLEPRTTSIIVAGIRLDIAQEGAPPPPPPNPSLVSNGTFDTNIDGWIWYDSRYPNGIGSAVWTPLDAGNNPTSGSISLRDTGSTKALQRLQCLPVARSTSYRVGAQVRTTAPKEKGDGTIAVFTFSTPDCTGDFLDSDTRVLSPAQPNTWQSYAFTTHTGSRTQSVILIIASGAVQGSFETLFDDVFFVPAE
ncbi:MAG TPA: BACON domain-containing carbohydrate-binding protein [Thermoanaerobaculia bacterium]|nr:BACON domain-containing carbohydrate-binding protein [Thermoanaerobaculia bacterium]